MTKNLTISSIQIKTENGFTELGGYLDEDYVYFNVPEEFTLHLSAEWLVSVALLEAMATNHTIQV